MTEDTAPVHIRAFLIADIRGYTAFTRERGDEAAAELATMFARITRDVVGAHDGDLIELRGDEALAVFTSIRQSLRAAVELQIRYARHSVQNEALRLPVGIGIDAGEAVPVEGGYRGAALNMAARLCSAAGPGEVLTTQAVSHLAGTIEGLEYTDRRLRNVKGVDEPVRAVQVSSEPLRDLLAGLPALKRRPGRQAANDLGTQISSMIEEQLSLMQDQVDDQLSGIAQMPQMQHYLPRRAREERPAIPLPPESPHAPRDGGRAPTTGTPILIAAVGLIVLAVLVAGVVLWLHLR